MLVRERKKVASDTIHQSVNSRTTQLIE